jgi:hypothetical protein
VCVYIYIYIFGLADREKERESDRRKKEGGSERGARNYISGFEGSQALRTRPSGRSTAYDVGRAAP